MGELHKACIRGDLKEVTSLLSSENINIQNSDGKTPLYVASEYGDLNTAKVLTSWKECDLNTPDRQGNTPLHIACMYGPDSIVQLLVADQRCQLNTMNRRRETPLLLASENGRLHTVKVLLSRKECDFNILDELGNTPLHRASKYNHQFVVEFLIVESNLRCQLNTQNRKGETALHLASEYGYLDTVTILLRLKECNLNIPNEQGDTPLHTAVKHGHHFVVHFLVADKRCQLNTKNSAMNTPLHIACHTKALEIIRLLLGRRCSANIPNKKGETAKETPLNEDGDYLLHVACLWGDVDIIRYLVTDQKCDPNVLNKHHLTPLLATIKHGEAYVTAALLQHAKCDLSLRDQDGNTACILLDIVKVLLSRKECDLNIAGDGGSTPLHTACKYGHHSTVEFLVADKRCQLNAQNREGKIPLHIASECDDLNTVKVLISSKDCDLNISDEKGNTPLHSACKYGHHSTVEFLVADKRCQLNAQNREGKIPLHIASECDDLNTVKVLISSKDCDLNISDEKGNTPLHSACKYGHHSTIEFLVADQRCQLNTKNSEMNTPLHIACHTKALRIIRLLLDRKCTTNTPNKKGETAEEIPLNKDGDCLLHIACQWCDVAIVRYLITDQRCNLNIANASGNTPLHIATEQGQLDIVKVLLSMKECDLNIAGQGGNTPLHSACMYGHRSTVEFLVADQRCQLNVKNRNCDTPLHTTVSKGNLQLCEQLMTNIHCDVNTLNKASMTPLLSAIEHNKASVATALLQHKKCDLTLCDHVGNTALHLACIRGETQMEMVKVAKQLISRVDPSPVNSAGQTPIELTTNYEIIQAISHFTKCKAKHSVQTYINLFIVGNPETGKSTLVKAICKEAGTLWKIVHKKFRRIKNVPPHTAGIIPTTFQSKIFGNTVLYDLAGQIEYYTSHAAVIQTKIISTPPAFIIVVNMSESEEKISETLRYWWSFINNHAARASAPPQVILVGSHADKVKAMGGSAQEKMSQMSTLLKHLPTSFHFAGQVALDCRDPASKELQLFCSLVNNSCTLLRQTADVDLRCHVLYAFLLDKFSGTVACTVSDIATIIHESDALLPQSPDGLIPLISTLSDKGLLLLVRDSVSSEDSWVTLQKDALLCEINGTIFAPKYFNQHKKDLSSSTGVVPFLKLKSEFPDYDPAMIAKFLTHLEFCFKVDDHETLELLKDEIVHEEIMSQSLSEEYYFFPALVSLDNPLQVWKQDDVMISQCGWFYRCSRQDQFLTTQFLHVLILRLAFSFALQLVPGDSREDSLALHRRCSVWKRGIGWLDRVPIETVVEVGLLNRSVIVIMRCPKGKEAECAQLRSHIIQKVLEAKDELCKAVAMCESFIHPTDIKYPVFDNTEDLKYYSLTEIAIATVKEADNVLDYSGRNPFPMKDLLLFDPQTTTSRELLRELFSEKHSLNEQLRGQVLEKLIEGEAVKMHIQTWHTVLIDSLQSCRQVSS